MSFSSDIASFNAKTIQKLDQVFDGVADEAFRSIVFGSEITGAPGQPFDPENDPNAGKLRDSWKIDRPSATEAVIATDVDYAPNVEDNIEGAHFRNHGPHSVKLTVTSFDRIVDVVGQKVAGTT
jgi:hypothetical protein